MTVLRTQTGPHPLIPQLSHVSNPRPRHRSIQSPQTYYIDISISIIHHGVAILPYLGKNVWEERDENSHGWIGCSRKGSNDTILLTGAVRNSQYVIYL